MTVVSGSISPTRELSGVPTLPATATGSSAARQISPQSSATVVLPLVPVMPTKALGSARQASSTSPTTSTPRSRASRITAALSGTPGLLTTQRTRSRSPTPSPSRWISTPRASNPSAPFGAPESDPITFSPIARSIRAAAWPERARPATRNGPSGSGGRGFEDFAIRRSFALAGRDPLGGLGSSADADRSSRADVRRRGRGLRGGTAGLPGCSDRPGGRRAWPWARIRRGRSCGWDGKLTRGLVGRFGRVIAVEPLEGMLAQLRQSLPEVEAHVGRAEEIPLEDGLADAVFCGQAFHWFANSEALAEIARVLRPGGGLALIWNISPWETREGPWFAALDDLLEGSRADLSVVRRHGSGVWREAFESDELFEELRGDGFEHSHRLTRESFVATMKSRSYIATLADAERDEILDAIEA